MGAVHCTGGGYKSMPVTVARTVINTCFQIINAVLTIRESVSNIENPTSIPGPQVKNMLGVLRIRTAKKQILLLRFQNSPSQISSAHRLELLPIRWTIEFILGDRLVSSAILHVTYINFGPD